MKLQSINPSNNQLLAEYNPQSFEEVTRIIENSNIAFLDWKKTAFSHRAVLLNKVSEILINRKEELGLLMSEEMGKVLKQSISEVEKCAGCCKYYAENSAAFLSKDFPTESKNDYVIFEPLGVVLAIMPWNFPLWQVFRFLAPTLMAGNAAVLKHASNVSGCALVIKDILKEAGFPENVFNVLLMPSSRMEEVISNKHIKAVSLTGSSKAGASVASIAGKYLKKCVLELGGNDAYIILEDADIDNAVKLCVEGRMQNNGQSCIAAKRFIVLEKIKERFEELFIKRMQTFKLGDPTKQDITLGPLARTDLRDDLHNQVEESVIKGAVCLMGGYVPDIPGAYYPATILSNVKPGMPAFDEELFGPVASIITAASETEAIELANNSIYGLGGGIFSSNIERAREIAEKHLESGSSFINSYVRSDYPFPFGGIKKSGYGRELGKYGITEFVNVKTIKIKP